MSYLASCYQCTCNQPRWQNCKLITRAQQESETGRSRDMARRLATRLACRLGHGHCHVVHPPDPRHREVRGQQSCVADVGSKSLLLQENRMFGRLQKRLIHCISQHLECQLGNVLTTSLPQPTSQDKFHPATKSPGSMLSNPFKTLHACRIQGTADAFDARPSPRLTCRWSASYLGEVVLRGRARCNIGRHGIVQHDAQPLHQAPRNKMLASRHQCVYFSPGRQLTLCTAT